MTLLKFKLYWNRKEVGIEEHRLIDDGLGNKTIHVYHSRTGHEMSFHEITMCPDEYLKHNVKIKVKI